MLNPRREKRTRSSRGDVWPQGFPLVFRVLPRFFLFPPLFFPPSILWFYATGIFVYYPFVCEPQWETFWCLVFSRCSVVNVLPQLFIGISFVCFPRMLLIVSHFGSALLPGSTRNEPNLEFLASRTPAAALRTEEQQCSVPEVSLERQHSLPKVAVG